jgi:hypothetical protein
VFILPVHVFLVVSNRIMSKQKSKYIKERSLTILLTSIMLPFGTFVGYEFGAGHTKTALIALGIQTALTVIHSTVWWFTMEKIKG